MKGAIHPSIGQEAVASGICSNLERTDILLSNHRGHGHTLAKGADASAMMCELFGRAEQRDFAVVAFRLNVPHGANVAPAQ